MISMIALALLTWHPPANSDVGRFVHALWLIQAMGSWSDSTKSDTLMKAQLFNALKDGKIQHSEIQALISESDFQALTGNGQELDATKLRTMVETMTPASRQKLSPSLRTHLDSLTTSLDMVELAHHVAIESLASWIAKNYQPGQKLDVIVVCTGNSRRSILGACLGNAAATYYGFEDLHFHSGGTAPTAFNARTIAALKAIGFEIEATGQEAPRGEPKTANPIYQVKWGPDLQTQEFSKHYADSANPSSNFAAIMVCGEADQECPTVKGAALRLSLPFLDPKLYDDSSLESLKYAERRDDIGRNLLMAIGKARNLLNRQP